MKFPSTLRTRRRLIFSFLASAFSVAQLGGCASYEQARQKAALTDASIQSARQELSAMRPQPVVKVVDRPYLLGQAVAVTHDPAALQQKVELATAQPLTLAQAAMFITQQTGVPVEVSSAILSRDRQSTSKPQAAGLTLPGLPGQPPVSVAQTLPGVSEHASQIVLNYSGSLKGLLDTLAAQTHTYWKYERGVVRFFLTETRIFEINALPGQMQMASTITNSGSGGSASSSTGSSGSGPSATGNSSQSAATSISLDPYKAIEDAVKTVLKQSGADQQSIASVSVDPSSGQLVVTATPPELDAVAQYVRTINAQMSKNVLIDVKVYSVSVTGNTDLSLSLNAALSGLLGGSAAATLNLGTSLGANASNNLSAGIVSGVLSGNALMAALSSIGHTSLVTSGSVIALNGQPSPLQISNSSGYLAQVSTTSTANVGSSTSLTPGSVISGFSATFLPLVRGDRILLEYALSLSQNLGFTTASSGGNTIQVPNTALQTTSNRVALKSGDTVVLAGFEQSGGTATDANGLSAFDRKGDTSRTALVITMHVVNLGS